MKSLGSLGYGRYRRGSFAGLGADAIDGGTTDPWGNIGQSLVDAFSNFITQLGQRLPGVLLPGQTAPPVQPSILSGLPTGLPMLLLIGGAIYLIARR